MVMGNDIVWTTFSYYRIYMFYIHLNRQDFDGDVLNILRIINEAFYQRAFQVFNPRNAMYISRNDGKFNNDVNHQRDTIINSNTMINLSRSMYSREELDRVRRIKQKYEKVF